MSPSSPSSSNPRSIGELCQRAVLENPDAIEQLIRYYHHRFLGFTVRKIGLDWKGKIEAEDVLQEAYVAVFKSIARFENRGEDAFYHWVTNIITRRFVDRIRHIRRQKRNVYRETTKADRKSSSYDALLVKCAPDLVTPAVHARRAEATSALLACIERLPESYRVVIERRYIKEDPVSEIAADLDRSEDAVRGLCSRALKTLAECLGNASKYLSS